MRMKPADDLKLHSIPPLPSDWTPPWELIDQLNVFAGQLYLRDYTSYLRLCRFLGVLTKASESSDSTKILRNLFNIPGGFEEMEITFSGSPLPAVMALLAIRTRGRPFAHTHMGRILQGQILTEKDFEVRPFNGSRLIIALLRLMYRYHTPSQQRRFTHHLLTRSMMLNRVNMTHRHRFHHPQETSRCLERRMKIHNHQDVYLTTPQNWMLYLHHLRATHETTLGHQRRSDYLCNCWPALVRYPSRSK